jgi:hypothetical protein
MYASVPELPACCAVPDMAVGVMVPLPTDPETISVLTACVVSDTDGFIVFGDPVT